MKISKKHIIFTGIFFLFAFVSGVAQEKPEKIKKESDKYIAEAQEALSENNFASAEASYRKAISKDPSNLNARYNMGNLYYAKEKSLNAEQRLKEATELEATKEEKHHIYHNLGNSFMQQKNYQEAVNAFKEALRNDPSDEETRYNLALAKKMLEKEKQNQDQNKKDEENKDENKDQQKKDQNQDGEGGEDENQDQKPQDEGENEKDKKEGDQDEDQQKDEGEEQKDDKGQGDKEKQQQPKPTQGQLSPQQIKNLLEAMNNEEKKVQDKINAEKAKGVKVKSEKDW